MRFTQSLLAALAAWAATCIADPTWPSSVDELEEIMYQIQGFRARKFADTIFPCSNENSGPGRHNAAEWLRTGFHDMATANTFFGLGGLDASLQYELSSGENTGPGFNTTLRFMSDYFTSRSSVSDLIALGVYASVRSCGGPVIPVKAGRIDATTNGSPGVPQPQNSVGTFTDQFARMGFSAEEMIQVTACGHTLGGVHSAEFPDLVPANAPNGNVDLDSTEALFDSAVITEYLDGTTANPLVVGPSVKLNKNSDTKVFNADKNVTVTAMKETTVFRNTCKAVLQKMIEVVPKDVTLTEPIAPYTVKPVALQLSLNTGASALLLSGYIRVRTTNMPLDTISSITLTYKDRTGGCEGGACTISATVQGVGKGFDDSFAFFPISSTIPITKGISSYTVTVNKKDGSTQLFNNNGNSYPISDAVFLQSFQSCLRPSTGSLTATAAVRNDRTSQPVNMQITYKTTQSRSPVPKLNNATVAMTKGQCYGDYTFYSVTYTVPGTLSDLARIDVISGAGAAAAIDSFHSTTELGGTCQAFQGGGACAGVSATSSTPSSTATSSSRSASGSSTRSSSSTSPIATLSHTQVMGGYKLISCWTEGSGTRALKGASYTYDGMTLETCMKNCTGYAYWGTEYGRECYCGNALDKSSSSASSADCNMVCGGNKNQYCGAGNRLELYSTTAAQPTLTTTTTTTPTTKVTQVATTTSARNHVPTVSPYTFLGCYTEGTGVRALAAKTYSSGNTMTVQACATFCKDYSFFGTEYGGECYCGNTLASSSTKATLADCDMACSGASNQFCGGGNRLELYGRDDATPGSGSGSGSTKQPEVVGAFTRLGCRTEGKDTRALGAKVTASEDMTLARCAVSCAAYDYFGAEYGSECYCGDAFAAGSVAAADADCNMACAGDATTRCGGSNRLSVYKKTTKKT